MKKLLALFLCLALLLPSLALADTWNCGACNKRNMDSVQFCLYCGMPRPAASAPSQPIVTAAPLRPVPGDTVYFGHFDQDYDYNDGGDPIEWIVLDNDGTSVVLISRYILHTAFYTTDYGPFSWANSDLRRWLNNDFYNQAFSRQEQSFIQYTYAGDPTGDSVILLSADEAMYYFPSDAARACESTRVAYTSGGSWWLRSPGRSDAYCAQLVKSNGYISQSGFNARTNSCGVRPVIIVDASFFH